MNSRGRVELVEEESEILQGNPLGDKTLRVTPVYLPPGYDESSRTRYPVIFLLAGFGGSGRSLLGSPPFDDPLIPVRVDRLIAAGSLPPVILACPNGKTSYGGSQYLDSPATGRYMTYVCDEIVPLVDRRFRTIPRREARAIAGKSSGGFGAFSLATRRPDLFCAFASHAGDAYFEWCYGTKLPGYVRDLRSVGGLEAFLARFPGEPVKDELLRGLADITAMSMAYSGNDDGSFDLPVDMVTGELVSEVWARWKANDPTRVVLRAEVSDRLRELRAIYLDAGDADEHFLDMGATTLSDQLRSFGVEHRFEIFRGNHRDVQARYNVSLPFLAATLNKS